MMAGEFIKITIVGEKELEAAINKFPREAARYLSSAGKEAASKTILPTQGLKKYPPAGSANAPPTPYYIRGRGMQYKSKNTGSSEKLGTQWTVEGERYNTIISNRASYAHWVHGEDQASFMAPKGWRKLSEVVKEKMEDVVKVYQLWVDKLLRDVGLK